MVNGWFERDGCAGGGSPDRANLYLRMNIHTRYFGKLVAA